MFTPPPDPPLLKAAGFGVLWYPDLKADATVLTEEKLCIFRTGLSLDRLAQVVEDIWDGWWAKYGDAAVSVLVAEILTGVRPECSHRPAAADRRSLAE